MKLEGYEMVNAFVTPAYWFVEGDEKERYYLDEQNMIYHELLLGDKLSQEEFDKHVETRKYWIISPYKPKGKKVTEENAYDIVKWLVSDSYHTDLQSPYMDDVDYAGYEWDWEKHCVKID